MDDRIQEYIEAYLREHSLPRNTVFVLRGEQTIVPDDVGEIIAGPMQGRPVTLHRWAGVPPDEFWLAEADRGHVEVIKMESKVKH